MSPGQARNDDRAKSRLWFCFSRKGGARFSRDQTPTLAPPAGLPPPDPYLATDEVSNPLERR
jgi:hypothetical protein